MRSHTAETRCGTRREPRRGSSGRRGTLVAEIPLVGAGGKPVDFARTIVSHDVAELAPNRFELEARLVEATLPIRGGVRTVRRTESGRKLRIEAVAGRVGTQDVVKTM